MKSVRSMTVTQFRIFEPDLIPYRVIVTPGATSVIEKVMGFRSSGRLQEFDEMVFRDGSFQITEGGPVIVISEMHINERRIILQVEGNSKTADQAYAMLKAIVERFGERVKDAEPMFFTEETRSVVELEFDWSSLVSPELAALANEFVSVPADPLAQQYVKSMSAQIIIGTRIDKILTESGVVATDKALVIEPRIDVPLSERVYFTRSPTDSETHLALVKDLEARLIKRPAKHR
jgi:hypothetical protein